MYLSPKPALCEALPMLDNALLWTMRAWVIGHCRNRDTAERINAVFGKLGAATATGHLGGFMTVLSRGAVRSLEINCVCHPAVSDDEATLLEIVSLQQHERHEEAYERLVGMTTEAAAVAGCDQANRLALALIEAGRVLATRPDFARQFTELTSEPFAPSHLNFLH